MDIFSLVLEIVVIDSSEQNKKKQEEKEIRKGYVAFTQFLFEVIFFIGGSILLGLYLDKLLGTKFVFLLILVLIFSYVPIYNLIKRMK